MPRVVVPPEASGERLDRFVAAHPEVATRARAERLIGEGGVAVDGVQRAKSFRLAPGSAVTFAPPRAPRSSLEPVELPLRIAYEDEHLLVVDKPAGLLVHPVPGHDGPTLVHALLAEAGGGDDPVRPGIVHRLDRDTSGLLVVARSEPALRRLQALLRRRRIERRYRALVRGRPASRAGTIDAPVGRDRREPTRMSVATDVPREARTHFAIVEALPGRTLLDVTLETGRTHQIRVHLAAIGHPVVGDVLYGHGPELGLARQFLHAAELRFPHPMRAGEVHATSPLPPDLAGALAGARG